MALFAVQKLPLVKALALLLAAAFASAIYFVWLWREWLLYAIALSTFLLFGGSLLFSVKGETARAIVLGAAIGAFIGSVIGIAVY